MDLKLVIRTVFIVVLTACGCGAQSSSDSSRPLGCGQWEHLIDSSHHLSDSAKDASTTMVHKEHAAYLHGLQYGYEDALFGYLAFLEERTGRRSDSLLDNSWTTLLVPPKDREWESIESDIDEGCSRSASAGSALSIIDVVRNYRLGLTTEQGRRILEDERVARIVGYNCGAFLAAPSAAFVKGFLDGESFLWSEAASAARRIEQSSVDQKIRHDAGEINEFIDSASRMHQADTHEIFPQLTTLCSDRFNHDVPFGYAFGATRLNTDGKHEDVIDRQLYGFRCKKLPDFWAQGMRLRGATCQGATVIGGDLVQDKPFGYMVAIQNDTGKSVDVDWSDWSLVSTDNEGRATSRPALDPKKLSHSFERKARIAAALAAFGASMSATTPRSAVVYGSGGVKTVTIYPSSADGSVAAASAAEQASAKPFATADTIDEFAVMRTTLLPGTRLIGMVFFDKPKSKQLTLIFKTKEWPSIAIDVGD